MSSVRVHCPFLLAAPDCLRVQVQNVSKHVKETAISVGQSASGYRNLLALQRLVE